MMHVKFIYESTTCILFHLSQNILFCETYNIHPKKMEILNDEV